MKTHCLLQPQSIVHMDRHVLPHLQLRSQAIRQVPPHLQLRSQAMMDRKMKTGLQHIYPRSDLAPLLSMTTAHKTRLTLGATTILLAARSPVHPMIPLDPHQAPLLSVPLPVLKKVR